MAMWATSPEYVDEVPMMQLVEEVLLHILGPLHPRFMREIESWNLTTAASFHFLIQCWQYATHVGTLAPVHVYSSNDCIVSCFGYVFKVLLTNFQVGLEEECFRRCLSFRLQHLETASELRI